MPILRDILLSFLCVFGLFSACHAILTKRDPRAGFGWVVACLGLVGLGPVLYWFFGINRIRTHARRRFRLGNWKQRVKTEEDTKSFQLPQDSPFYQKNYRELLNVSEKVNRLPLMIGNDLGILYDGEEAYPAMLEAIEKAQKFIYLCTYIFDSDETGLEFVAALAKAKARGVQIWVLVDAFGEKYSRPPIHRILRREKIRVERFMPLSLSLNTLHFNLRNHRKVLVVDGETAFTGGMNIRGRHLTGSVDVEKRIHDIHFKIQGPAVLELQEIFLEDWYFATRESLPWMGYPHALLPGNSVCRIISGGPNEDFEKIHWLLLGALSWAKKKVQIMTPYFVPDRILITALNTAALKGVEVEIILPEKNNLPFVQWACRALLWEMLQNGVKFYLRPPPFAHGKLLVVDDAYALVGSSNWDARSLRLNFELDVEVYDPVFAKLLSGHFEEIRLASKPVTLDQIQKDSGLVQFRNALMKLFSPYL